MIPLSRPYVGAEEVTAVSEVLRTGMLVQGTQVREFERRVADYCKRTEAIAVSNGTSALRLALQAIGIGPGDHVLCPNLSWPSPAHAVIDCGAEPILVDVDSGHWNVTANLLRAKITPRTRAAIVIDQFGNPAPFPEIAKNLKDVTLIVDAACSLGSRIGSNPCGGLGTIACLSFHPRKVITTGEGGMCLTDDPELAERIRILRNHGQSSTGVFERSSGNYRLTDIAAAIGIVQMSRIDQIIQERRLLAEQYQRLLRDLNRQQTVLHSHSNYQTFGVLLPSSADCSLRDKVIHHLRTKGIQAGLLSFALHRLNPLTRYAKGAYPTSSTIADRGIALPLYPGLTFSEQERVVSSLLEII